MDQVQVEEAGEDAEEPSERTAWHWLAAALYLPILGVIGYLIIICVVARFHGTDLGLYHFLYSVVFLVLAWRWTRILRGRVRTAQLWGDCLAMALADAFVVFLFLAPRLPS